MPFWRKNKFKPDNEKVDLELEEIKETINLEKGDTLAMIIAALTVFLPVLIIICIIIVLLFHFIVPLW
jgi:type IV secretory pathway component VirB8